jgi:glucose/mannose transport system substrate-binding protein
MSMSGWARWGLLAGLGLVACSSGNSSNGAPSGNVEIYSWWTSGSEQKALKALLNDYAMQYPNVSVINAAEQSSQTAMTDLQKRMADGNPPDTFQTNGGLSLLQYVVTNGRDASQTKLENLDFLAAQEGWMQVMPTAVLNTVSYGGHYYAVPVDIARINALFYNTSVFTQNGLQPPQSLADFVTVSKALQAAGIAAPLAVGDAGPWVLEVIFKSCLVAEGGADYYTKFVTGQNPYFAGTSTTPDAVFAQALADFGQIMQYANLNTMRSLTWDQAVALVKSGSSAMTIMGDWAIGEFISEGAKPGVDFGQMPAPGSEQTFIFTTDVFVLPKGAPNRTGSISLLTEWGSNQGQAAFNPVKGSISVRSDADPTLYNPLSQKTIQDFHTLPLVGDFSLTTPATFSGVLDPALDQYVNDGIIPNVVLAVRNNYASLAGNP